nr:sugar transporter ERD6-like 16 [Tanacetum cinerariifolium]
MGRIIESKKKDPKCQMGQLTSVEGGAGGHGDCAAVFVSGLWTDTVTMYYMLERLRVVEGSLLLDMGRFFIEYGIGIFTYVVPIYVADIAPKELREELATLNQFMIVTGSRFIYIGDGGTPKGASIIYQAHLSADCYALIDHDEYMDQRLDVDNMVYEVRGPSAQVTWIQGGPMMVFEDGRLMLVNAFPLMPPSTQ